MNYFPPQSGPCVICGDTNYGLSCGGPTICPKCDCGNFDAATVLKQAKVIEGLRAEKLTLHKLADQRQAKYCDAGKEIKRLRDALCEIANRASNMLDPDAAEWMPSIYKIACEAIGQDPGPIEGPALMQAQRVDEA